MNQYASHETEQLCTYKACSQVSLHLLASPVVSMCAALDFSIQHLASLRLLGNKPDRKHPTSNETTLTLYNLSCQNCKSFTESNQLLSNTHYSTWLSTCAIYQFTLIDSVFDTSQLFEASASNGANQMGWLGTVYVWFITSAQPPRRFGLGLLFGYISVQPVMQNSCWSRTSAERRVVRDVATVIEKTNGACWSFPA